ncbi:MAG: hypothetical protein RL264_2946 [Bacteroidota bacterium]|jgi:uncharacterized protein YkwD
MKTKFLTLFLMFNAFLGSFAQTWTAEEKQKANTFAHVKELSTVEKEAMLYINLARMYPQKFAKIELANYEGTRKFPTIYVESEYIETLKDELAELEPMQPIQFDEEMQEKAECFATEQGLSGYVGHKRKNCSGGNFAECCSYGMDTGRDIALQLLIDHDVPSLGHRKNCLNPKLLKAGISFADHKKHEFCAVIDLYF